MSSTGPVSESGHNKLSGDLFDNEATLYDRYRPSYPVWLFNLLAKESHLSADSNLLEIGAGTGQATLPMAERGFQFTALEPGQQLSDILRRKATNYPNVSVITGKFEDLDLPEGSFDLIYGATSLHWINPETLFSKTAQLLKPGGYMASIYNELVETEEDVRFYNLFEPIVLRYGVTSVLRAGTTPETANPVGPLVKHMEGLAPKYDLPETFEKVGFFVQDPPQAVEYHNAADYINYLRTISHVLQLPENERKAFFSDVTDIVEANFGGAVTLHFAATMQLARKR